MLSARAVLAVVEPLLYAPAARRAWAVGLAAATAFLLVEAVQIRPDASFGKFVPSDHPYMHVLEQYRHEFGGANALLVALVQKNPKSMGSESIEIDRVGAAKSIDSDPIDSEPAKDIYNTPFMTALKSATDEVFFTPGVDRARVSSLFTPDVRFYEVVEGGFGGGANVVPPTYSPSQEMFDIIRANVEKAGIVGRYVTNDQRGAMIFAEVLENDPATGKHEDHAAIAQHLEEQVRRRFASPKKFELKLRAAHEPFAAGEVIATEFAPPGWDFRWRHFTARRGTGSDEQRVELTGSDLDVAESDNADYRPDIDVHIIGFTKLVGDVAGAVLKVVGFFVLTVAGTMLILWWYLGRFRLALLPLLCSLAAVVWEFGLLRLFGYGLDPFAILVPFLVLAVSTSHGVQYVNTWADEVMHGKDGFDASRETFRRLFIPGSIALLTNVAGFATIAQVPIGIVREMSANACLGMAAVIVSNKVLMPVWLSYLSLHDVEDFRDMRKGRRERLDALWNLLSHAADRRVAMALVALSLVVLGGSWQVQKQRIVGDTQVGVPELRPESTYNRDSRAIAQRFRIGVDQLKLFAEADPNSCIEWDVQDQIDRFQWRLQNTPGVASVASMPQIVALAYQAFSEGAIKFRVLPRNKNVMVLLNTKLTTETGLLNWDCSTMPLFVFTTDHKAPTIAGILDAASKFTVENEADYFGKHHDVDAAYCAEKTAARRQIGLEQERRDAYADRAKSRGMKELQLESDAGFAARKQAVVDATEKWKTYTKVCPVNFAAAAGNVGVMAATNEVVERKELSTVLAVYAVIVVCLWLAYRSLTPLLAICVPLFMVSIFANALMAMFGIGLKVATLPVVALAVGIGVDYGIYFYDVLQHEVYDRGRSLREACFETLHQTGKAVILTGLCLAGGVASWWWSDLQFQRDMGVLLAFMFTANMLGAVFLCPAYCRFLMKLPKG